MSDYVRDHKQAVCECGHASGEHDDWPECEACACVEFKAKP